MERTLPLWFWFNLICAVTNVYRDAPEWISYLNLVAIGIIFYTHNEINKDNT